jgi:hypothetical protein
MKNAAPKRSGRAKIATSSVSVPSTVVPVEMNNDDTPLPNEGTSTEIVDDPNGNVVEGSGKSVARNDRKRRSAALVSTLFTRMLLVPDRNRSPNPLVSANYNGNRSRGTNRPSRVSSSPTSSTTSRGSSENDATNNDSKAKGPTLLVNNHDPAPLTSSESQVAKSRTSTVPLCGGNCGSFG